MVDALLRVVLVDDEPPARQILRAFLEGMADVVIVGEFGSGADVIAALATLDADVLLLDIQMPEMDGFDVLAALEPDRLPAVVFVTAYDRFAVRAFDVAAVDYLLKPFDHERLASALGRARRSLKERSADERTERILNVLGELRGNGRFAERLVSRDGERVRIIAVDDVEWIEADGNYVRLHAASGRHLVRETMRSLEVRLDPQRFVRIHRSAIVRVAAIRELQPHVRADDMVVVLESGARPTLSRRYRQRLSAALGSRI